MVQLRELNNYILEEYKHLSNREELSIPLLITSDSNYINNLQRRILYIGQETNCWMNYHDEKNIPSIEDIENKYYEFLNSGARNRDYWKFIKTVLNINDSELSNNVIWNNVFVAGKRTAIGHPDNKALENLSIEYLTEVTRLLNPEYTIFVSGPSNPYYHMIIEYLKQIKSSLINTYPTLQNPIVNDSKIIWTYHPNYQNRMHQKVKIIEKTKEIINK